MRAIKLTRITLGFNPFLLFRKGNKNVGIFVLQVLSELEMISMFLSIFVFVENKKSYFLIL